MKYWNKFQSYIIFYNKYKYDITQRPYIVICCDNNNFNSFGEKQKRDGVKYLCAFKAKFMNKVLIIIGECISSF